MKELNPESNLIFANSQSSRNYLAAHVDRSPLLGRTLYLEATLGLLKLLGYYLVWLSGKPQRELLSPQDRLDKAAWALVPSWALPYLPLQVSMRPSPQLL